MNKRERAAGGDYMQSCYGPANVLPTTVAAYSPNISWFNHFEKGDDGQDSYYVKSGGGTSSATPQVAAAAALYIQKHKDKLAKHKGEDAWKKAEIVRQALFLSCDDSSIYTKEYFGNGTLKADRALEPDLSPDEIIKDVERKLKDREKILNGITKSRKAVHKNTFGGLFHLYSNRNVVNKKDSQISGAKKKIIKEMLMEEIHQLVHLDKDLHEFQDLDFGGDPLDLTQHPELTDGIVASSRASAFLKKTVSLNFYHKQPRLMLNNRTVLQSKLGQTIVSSDRADFSIINEKSSVEGAGDNAFYIDEFEIVLNNGNRDFSNGAASVTLEIAPNTPIKTDAKEKPGLSDGQFSIGDELHSVVLLESTYEDGTVLEWQIGPNAKPTGTRSLQELFSDQRAHIHPVFQPTKR